MAESPNDWTRLTAPPGSRVLIAGGAGDIGRAVVGACLANGHDVMVLDLPRSLERHPVPSGVPALAADATNAAEVEAAFRDIDRRWTAIDALVFLVGFTIAPPIWQAPRRRASASFNWLPATAPSMSS